MDDLWWPQWGCAGRHHGTGAPDCPRELHHHHDAHCHVPPIVRLMCWWCRCTTYEFIRACRIETQTIPYYSRN